VDAVDGAGFHRMADVRPAAGQGAVVAGPLPGAPVLGNRVAVCRRVTGYLRGAAVADGQQAFVG
jgi:hypothetical protein